MEVELAPTETSDINFGGGAGRMLITADVRPPKATKDADATPPDAAEVLVVTSVSAAAETKELKTHSRPHLVGGTVNIKNNAQDRIRGRRQAGRDHPTSSVSSFYHSM